MQEPHDRLTLPAARRMIRKRDFDRAFAARCSAGDRLLVVYVAANETGLARVGLAVGRRHGNAVQRNRLRRLLREAFRLQQHDLPGGFDYLLVPRPGCRADLASCRRSVVRLGRDAARRWRTQHPTTGP